MPRFIPLHILTLFTVAGCGVLPVDETPESQGEFTVESVSTRDGATLTVKHRARLDCTPVVFLHGLAVNAEIWDLPTVTTDAYTYRSLASELYDAGFDVWLVNFRGHGAEGRRSTPPEHQDDWTVDHFVLYDLPAVIDHVSAATGRRPFVIGSSMGSMVLAGYVQGAVLEGEGAALRIIADPAVAASRCEALAGCVFVEFPSALRWPESVYDEDGYPKWDTLLRDWWRTDTRVNAAFEIAARLGWLETLIAAHGGINLDRLRPSGRGEEILKQLPKPVADAWRQAETTLVQFGLNAVGTFWGTGNLRAEVLLRGRRYVVDRIKAGVLSQMAKSVRAQAFVSALGQPDHVYSDHYDQINLPALVIAGGRDRIANAGVIREDFFERVSSADKTMLVFDEIGHGEFEAAPIATEQVYPAIQDWLIARDSRAMLP